MRSIVLATALMCSFSATAVADSDLERLAKGGYAVIEETNVDGDFEGCEYDKPIPLMNGLIFVCQSYGYSYSYMADVLILQHIRHGDVRVIIDDEEYEGALYQQ